MRKRILSIICVCFVLGALIMALSVPAFAVSDGTGTQYFSPLQIETIELGSDGVRQSWLFNDIQSGTERYEFEFGGLFNEVSWLDGYARFDSYITDLQSLNSPTITLRAQEMQIVSFEALSSVSFQINNMNAGSCDVVVTYDYWIPDIVNDAYTLEQIYIYTGYEATGVVPIGDIIVNSLQYYADNFYYGAISNLTITITPESVSDLSNGFNWTWDGMASPISPDVWVNNLALAVDVYIENANYFDVTYWIAEALGALLNFEFAPGFSINMIFGVLVVIAIVLFVITLSI